MPLGEIVPAGAPLFEMAGAPERINMGAAVRAIEFGLERTLDQDMAYGLRMLVDIAERSLSNGPFLDPTTAVQAIDRLHDCLRQLAPRSFPDGRYRDKSGNVRLVMPSMAWEDYVHLAFDEIRMAGARSPQVDLLVDPHVGTQVRVVLVEARARAHVEQVPDRAAIP